MNEHQIIEIFSSQWFMYTVSSFLAIVLVILIGKNLNQKGKRYLRLGLGITALASAVLLHPFLIAIDLWSLQSSLPLHLCKLSEIIAVIALIWRHQRIFEILCYWGIPGGIHSILTPELLYSSDNGWLIFHFYFQHAIIILAPVYLMSVCGMRLRPGSWFKTFLFTNLCIPVIGTINWVLESNYMYLATKPIADNPFLVGDWPWYIIVLDLVLLVHFYLVFVITTKKLTITHFMTNTKTSKI